MVYRSGSGVSKSFLTSLAALLLVAFFAITTERLSGSSVGLIRKQTPSVIGNIAEDPNLAARSPLANSSLLAKRVPSANFQQRVVKGRWLSCRLRESIQTARLNNGGRILETQLTDPGVFETEGWRLIDNPQWPLYGNDLNTAFAALQINPALNIKLDYNNIQSGVLLPPSGPIITVPTTAKFENVLIPESGPGGGVIIADANFGPIDTDFLPYDPSNPQGRPPISRIYQWSDAAFLEWRQACNDMSANLQNLNYIFRSGIQNPDTQSIIVEALQNLNPPVNILPGNHANAFTFSRTNNPDAFHALLGSKNGAGCAFLLLTHKTDMGVRDITSVTVWHSKNGNFDVRNYNPADPESFWPTMYFTIVSVPNPS